MAYEDIIVDASIEAVWDLQDDAASTAIIDSSGNAIDGVLTSGDTSVATVAGPSAWLPKAINLDGIDDYISFLTLPALSNLSAWTVSCWWKCSTTSQGTKTLYSWGGSATNRMHTLSPGYNKTTPSVVYGRVAQQGTSVDEALSAPVNTSVWRHMAWVKRAGAGIELYQNGVSLGTIASDIAVYNPITKHAIGRNAHDANAYWPGAIAGLHVWSRSLSTTEVGYDYAGPSADTTPPTVVSVTVDAAGTSVTVVFDEAVAISDATGVTLDDGGSGVTFTYASGTTTDTIVFIPSRTLLDVSDDASTFEYDSGTGNITDIATNALASITGQAIINGSTQTADVTAPTVVQVIVSASEVLLQFDEEVTGYTGLSLVGSTGTALTVSGWTGTGTANYSGTLSRAPISTESVALVYAPGNIEDLSGNALDAISYRLATNNVSAVAGTGIPRSRLVNAGG
jgi:hypothetical protein